MELVQQTICRSDFDITFPGCPRPTCRALLPEHVRADGGEFPPVVHVLPGRWDAAGDGLRGRFRVNEALTIDVSIADGGDEALVELGFTNASDLAMCNVEANICLATNHLPGSGGFDWCNREFIPPRVPQERSAQGRYWYAEGTPRDLRALTDAAWRPVHANPADPDPDKVPMYGPAPTAPADVRAVAVRAPAGDLFLYQAWDVPCRPQPPFPGNACMHLQPLVAAGIAPGQTARIHGRLGVHRGDWDSLARLLSVPAMR